MILGKPFASTNGTVAGAAANGAGAGCTTGAAGAADVTGAVVGPVGGKGVALTTGFGTELDGLDTMLDDGGGVEGGDASGRVTAPPWVYATPFKTKGSEVATAPEATFGWPNPALVPDDC